MKASRPIGLAHNTPYLEREVCRAYNKAPSIRNIIVVTLFPQVVTYPPYTVGITAAHHRASCFSARAHPMKLEQGDSIGGSGSTQDTLIRHSGQSK